MPSKTPKQKKFMAAVANSPKFAKKVGVPQSVGKEFAAADKAKEDAEEFDGPGMQWDGIDDYDAELPAGHYDTHVRLQRGGRWNAHTVNVRKTDKELIQKFLDQGFRIVKPFDEDNEEPTRSITGMKQKLDALAAAQLAGSKHKPYVSSFVGDESDGFRKIFAVLGSDGKIAHKTRDKREAHQWLKDNYENI